MKGYFKYLGIYMRKPTKLKVTEKYEKTEVLELATRHLEYLKELDSYQKERKTTIENKNSQLVGQASIVTSIFALFVPLLIDSFNGINIIVKIGLSLLFLVILAHYIVTILHAIRTLKINKYKYATRSTSTITKKGRATSEVEFLNEEISDLVFTINQNSQVDNEKGENLIFATRSFEIANIGFALLTVLIILTAFCTNEDESEVILKNVESIEINTSDTTYNHILTSPCCDTPIVKQIECCERNVVDTTAN